MSQQDQPIPSVPGSGSADATQYTQTNSVRIFNEFIEANKGRYPYGAWDRMKAQDFCDRQLWEDFAGFLCETYKSPSGTLFKNPYLRILVFVFAFWFGLLLEADRCGLGNDGIY